MHDSSEGKENKSGRLETNQKTFLLFQRILEECAAPILFRVAGDSKLHGEVKLLREEMERNRDLIFSLDHRLNLTIDNWEKFQKLSPPPPQIPTTPSQELDQSKSNSSTANGIDSLANSDRVDEALNLLQRQLDNVTEVILEAHRRRFELLIAEAKNEVKKLEEKISNRLNRLGMEYDNSMLRLSKQLENLAQTQAAMLSASPFHCESGYVTSDALTTSLSHSKFVPFSPPPPSTSSSTSSPSTFSAPPVVILGSRYAGIWPRRSPTPMRPRGGGGTASWFANGGGLASWFNGGGLLDRVGGGGSAVDSDEGRRAVNFGVWIEGRPSVEGFIVAFQTGNPDPDARISANWMACGN